MNNETTGNNNEIVNTKDGFNLVFTYADLDPTVLAELSKRPNVFQRLRSSLKSLLIASQTTKR
jgi:hypothetical protein